MISKINNTTKNDAIQVSKRCLQTVGFNGFSFQTIADELGIKKASLHYYFKSKDDLGIAIVENYELLFTDWVSTQSDKNPIEQIEKFIFGFFKISNNCNMICPIGVLSNDYNSLSAKLQKRVYTFHFTQHRWLIEVLNKGKKEKLIAKHIQSNIMADMIMSTLQGGIQIARIRQENDSYKIMVKNILKLLINN